MQKQIMVETAMIHTAWSVCVCSTWDVSGITIPPFVLETEAPERVNNFLKVTHVVMVEILELQPRQAGLQKFMR